MIYSLLTQHLQNQLLDHNKPLTQFQLNQVSQTTYADSTQFEYEISGLEPHLIIEKYDFEYEFNFETQKIEQLDCILVQVNGTPQSVKIDLLNTEHPLPTLLVQKVIIKKSTPLPQWQPHAIATILIQNSKHKKSVIISTDLNLIQGVDVQYNEQKQEKKDKKEKKENKEKQDKKVHKEKKVKLKENLDINQISVVKIADEPKTKEQPIIQKQLFKVQDTKLQNLAKKLEIPQQWKKVALEFSEQQKKKWDIKYYEKLSLLRESISKKYFYSHILKEQMEEEYQKKFLNYAPPADLKDPAVVKQRKIYNREVVCALIE